MSDDIEHLKVNKIIRKDGDRVALGVFGQAEPAEVVKEAFGGGDKAIDGPEVAEKTGAIEGVRSSHVKLTWDPPWTKDRMSDEALLELGLL